MRPEKVSALGRIINTVTLRYGKYKGYAQVPYAHKLNVRGILCTIITSIVDNIVEMDNYNSNKQRNAQELLVLRDYTKLDAGGDLLRFDAEPRQIVSKSCFVLQRASRD